MVKIGGVSVLSSLGVNNDKVCDECKGVHHLAFVCLKTVVRVGLSEEAATLARESALRRVCIGSSWSK